MPTVVAPHIVHVSAPPHRSSASAAVVPVATARHRKARHAVPVAHVRHVRPTVAKPVSLASPLAFFTGDLLRLVPAPFRAGAPDHRDGVLLLFSALAMAALAVSSFVLLRRLKRLGGPM